MNRGVMFRVNDVEYVIALCSKTGCGNAAVLLRRSGGPKCLTVSNLYADAAGRYSWERGYTAGSFDDAVSNFISRIAL